MKPKFLLLNDKSILCLCQERINHPRRNYNAFNTTRTQTFNLELQHEKVKISKGDGLDSHWERFQRMKNDGQKSKWELPEA